MKPLIQADTFKTGSDAQLHAAGVTREQLLAESAGATYWINEIYQVERREYAVPRYVHLCIRRRDGKPIFRDWRHFQDIKNQLIGPECEAVELYPAESRLVDSSNKYHLWGSLDPAYRFPFGYEIGRQVEGPIPGVTAPGMRQRPFQK